jgi:type VI secretion system protein VasD
MGMRIRACLARLRVVLLWGAIFAGGATLCGCSTAAVATGKVAQLAMRAVGFKVPGITDQPPQTRTVALHISGAKDLNMGDDGRGLSTVVRLYKLRDQTGFLSLPYTDFGTTDKERAALGTDLVDVKELVLSPGQTLDLQEKMSNDSRYFGIVALLRAPDPQRWRYAVALSSADSTPVAVAVNACALAAIPSPASETVAVSPASLPSSSCK